MSKINYHAAGYFVLDNTRYVFIDGITCDTMEKCYQTLKEQLSVPDYFGYNLDALEEVLADPEWILEEKILILVLHPAALLTNDTEKKAAFMDLLNSIENSRIAIHYLGSIPPFSGA
jgi:RNAse (barnase) inhibitor barstar